MTAQSNSSPFSNSNIDILSGTIDITDTTRFQCLYSSQNYGVFYEVFVKFKLNRANQLKSIKLKLINHKGPINIGFYKKKFVGDTLVLNEKEKNIEINFHSQGLSKIDTIEIESDTPIAIDCFDTILCFRTLMPLNHKTNTYCVHNVFDNEFYYRSGSNPSGFDKRKLRPGLFGYKPKQNNSNQFIILGRHQDCYGSINKAIGGTS